MPLTIDQALTGMRHLRDVDTGRLRGVSLRRLSRRLDLSGTPAPYLELVARAIAAHRDGRLGRDCIDYLVCSDSTVVVLLTAAGHVLRPDISLDRRQTRHQGLAIGALSDLSRYVLRELGERLAAAAGTPGATALPHTVGMLLVAPADAPTAVRWLSAGPDVDDAGDRLRAAGLDPHNMIILDGDGYGRYRRDKHRLDLDTLCAIDLIAAVHGVERSVVGDWLAAEGAVDADVDPVEAAAVFGEVYLGAADRREQYTSRRMCELGWWRALADVGIPARYVDVAAIIRDWFSEKVRAISAGQPARLEIFRRLPPGALIAASETDGSRDNADARPSSSDSTAR
jgi:hypothetical protein